MTELAQLKGEAVMEISSFIFRKFFKAYFESDFMLRCIANPEGEFELVNSAWQKELGFTPIEMRRKKFIDFVHPDDVEITQKEFKDILEGKETQCFINRYKTKSGKFIALEWSAKIDKDSGYVFGDARVIRKCITDDQMPCMCGHNLSEYCYRNPKSKRLANLIQSLD